MVELKFFLAFLIIIPQVPFHAHAEGNNYSALGLESYLRNSRTYSASKWLQSAQKLWADNVVLQGRIRANSYDNINRAMGDYSVNSIGESGKTIVIIMALHVAALVKAEARKKNMMGLDPEGPEWAELFESAATATINNFEFYTGGAGVFVTGMGLAGVGATLTQFEDIRSALNVLQVRIAESSAAKRHFLGLLKAGALSLVMFTVAEVSGQLWHEAVSMEAERINESELNTKQITEYMTAMNGLKMTEFIRSWFGGEQVSNLEKDIFSRLTLNMWSILWNDPDRRFQLFYNTWRKRIATSDFWLMVIAMTAAGYTGAKVGSTVGLAIGGPVGSAILAVMFGVAFVVIAGFVMMFVPQETKDWADQYFRTTRAWVNTNEMESWFRNLENGLNLMRRGWRESFILFRRSSMAINFLGKMSSSRQNLINVWIENYHLALQKKRFAEYENSIIALSSNPEFQQKIAELDAFQEDEDVPGTALNQFLTDHSGEVDGLLKQAQKDLSSERRIKITFENEVKITEAEDQLKKGELFFANFYEQHALRLSHLYHSRLYDTENFNIDPDITKAFDEEFKKLSYLVPELRWLALGLNPELADDHDDLIPPEAEDSLKAASLVKLTYYYETMYNEAKVIDRRIEAERASRQSSL